MRVLKFGGSVLHSYNDFLALKNIVQTYMHEPCVVVVSAIAMTTRRIESAVRLSEQGNIEEATKSITELFEDHTKLCKTLFTNTEIITAITLLFDGLHSDLMKIVRGIYITRQLTPKTLDKAVSYGEILSVHIVKHFLAEHSFIVQYCPAESIIVTDSTHNNAQPQRSKTLTNVITKLIPLFDSTRIVVTQGFIAADEHGTTTTMGKESSNLTATILGEALSATEVLIFSDVDGIKTVDPKIIPTSQTVQNITYSQAFRMAVHGVKLLYPAMIEPIKRSRIPLRITSMSASSTQSTTISEVVTHNCPPVITLRSDVIVLQIICNNTQSVKRVHTDLYSALNHTNILRHTLYTDGSVTLLHDFVLIHLQRILNRIIPEDCSVTLTSGVYLCSVLNPPQIITTHILNAQRVVAEQCVISIDSSNQDGVTQILLTAEHHRSFIAALYKELHP